MAVIFDPNKKDLDQNGQPIVTSSVANAPATPNVAPGTPTSSGRFSNLQNYLNANKQGAGLANRITSNIQNQTQKTLNNVQDAQKTFTTQADTAKPLLADEKTISGIKNPLDLNSQQQDQIKSTLRAKYDGPKSLADLEGNQNIGSLATQVANVQGLTQNVGTEQGRFELLRKMFGKPTYNAGQQKLDQLLLQGDPNQQKQLLALRSGGIQAGQALNQAKVDTEQLANKYTTDSNTAKTQVEDALRKAGVDLSANNQRLAQETDQATLDALRNLSGGLIPELINTQLRKYTPEQAREAPNSRGGRSGGSVGQVTGNVAAPTINPDAGKPTMINGPLGYAPAEQEPIPPPTVGVESNITLDNILNALFGGKPKKELGSI